MLTSHGFNEMVAMGLKSFRNGFILHLVMIYSKRKEVITDKLFKHWIALFGTPKMFLSGNRREFNNEDFREIVEQLNINICTTGAESPWNNSIAKKHNSVIGNMMEKVLADVNCSLEVALGWCLSAKNALLNS